VTGVYPEESAFEVRFQGRVPQGKLRAGDVEFDLSRALAVPCREAGQCFRVPYDAERSLAPKDAVTLEEG
jgi:hypothetical protein